MSISITNNQLNNSFFQEIAEEIDQETAAAILVSMKSAPSSTEISEASEISEEEIVISKINLQMQGLTQTKHDPHNKSDFKLSNILPSGSRRICKK